VHVHTASSPTVASQSRVTKYIGVGTKRVKASLVYSAIKPI
jgi:hypothetical protein